MSSRSPASGGSTLAIKLDAFLLRQLFVAAISLHSLQLFETLDGFLHGLEVGQQAAEPALIDVVLTGTLSFLADRILSLSLGADKEHGLSSVFGDCARDKRERVAKHSLGLLQVNNVNAVALAKDVFLHLWIPAPNLVAEMHAGFQKFFHRNRNQTLFSFAVNWFNVLTITAGPSGKSNQSELWQWS